MLLSRLLLKMVPKKFDRLDDAVLTFSVFDGSVVSESDSFDKFSEYVSIIGISGEAPSSR